MSLDEKKALTSEILPKLVGRMWGMGGLHLDTDSMDLDEEDDYHYLEWLAGIVADFILEDRERR